MTPSPNQSEKDSLPIETHDSPHLGVATQGNKIPSLRRPICPLRQVLSRYCCQFVLCDAKRVLGIDPESSSDFSTKSFRASSTNTFANHPKPSPDFYYVESKREEKHN